MGIYGAIIGGALGAAGGIWGNSKENKRIDAYTSGLEKYKSGMPRVYGTEQDALIKALAAGGSEQSQAATQVNRTELAKNLSQQQGSIGGIAGVRAAMGSGQEAGLAGEAGRSAAQESIGNMSGAGTNISQAAMDAAARNRLRLQALAEYDAAKKSRKGWFEAGVGGAANGAMAGAVLPV